MNLPCCPRVLTICTLVTALVGCLSLMTQPQEVTDSPDKVVVQIRAANRSPKTIQIPLTPDMRLQEVVEASKPPFRNRLAYIVRTSPKTGQQHKLEASFGSNRRVTMETDYAIQPGDRVVISEDTTTSFERVMKAMLGRS